MNIKLKAGLDVVKMLAFAMAVSGLTILVLNTVPFQTILTVAAFVFVAYMIYILYSIRLSQLEYQNTLKEMVDKQAK